MKLLFQILIGAIEAPLLEQGQAGLEAWFTKQYAKSPKKTQMLVSLLHDGLKGEAEDLAKKTSFKYDDDAVAAAEQELEAFAAEKGFTLMTFPDDAIPGGQPATPPTSDTGAGGN